LGGLVVGWLGGWEPAKEETRLKNRMLGLRWAGRLGGGWEAVGRQFQGGLV
jgi:hypothetical protein